MRKVLEWEVRAENPQWVGESDANYEARIEYELEALLDARRDARWLEHNRLRSSQRIQDARLDQEGLDWLAPQEQYVMLSPEDISEEVDDFEAHYLKSIFKRQLLPTERQEYLRYLASTTWYLKRWEVLDRDGHKCRNCGGQENLQVHHRHYMNLFHEDIDDLLTLCRTCHKRQHRRD